jgi:hypothetical protein
MPDSVVFDCLQSFTMQETINFFLSPYIKGLWSCIFLWNISYHVLASHLLLQTAAALSLGSVAPSVSFASAIAATGASSARTEGLVCGWGGGDFGRVYPVVFPWGSDRTICFGIVGVWTASFCIRKNCKAKSHFIRRCVLFRWSYFVVSFGMFTQPLFSFQYYMFYSQSLMAMTPFLLWRYTGMFSQPKPVFSFYHLFGANLNHQKHLLDQQNMYEKQPRDVNDHC